LSAALAVVDSFEEEAIVIVRCALVRCVCALSGLYDL